VTPLEALILGCVQGLTEFLPVSSSGHLLFASRLFGLQEGFIDFAVAAHLGSLAAVLLFVRSDVAAMLRQLQIKAVLRLGVATVPAAVVGILFKEALIPRSGWQLALAFLGSALFCGFMARGGEGRWRQMGAANLLFVGAFQATALVPGVSRSGATVWAALATRLSRQQALSFSFLLAAIAIGGASLLRAKHIAANFCNQPLPSVVLVASSFAFSLAALALLKRLVLRSRLWIFAPYLAVLAVLSALLLK